MSETCAICERQAILYTERSGRAINSVLIEHKRYTLCRECILKNLLSYLVLMNNREDPYMNEQALRMREEFRKTDLPAGI